LSKDGRRARSLNKAVAKAANGKIKPDDRRPALYALMEDASQPAILGLLKRFTFNYDTNIVADEEEKNYVYEGLLSMGQESVGPCLRDHLRDTPSLSWGLRILAELCDHEQSWDILKDVLKDYEPGYERDPSRKQQLLAFLGDFRDDRVPPILVDFLDDHDETVKFITIEGLFAQGDEAVAREPLLKLLISEEEESLRLKNRIAEGFVDKGWVVKGYRGSVEKALSADYVVDGKGRIRKKKARTA